MKRGLHGEPGGGEQRAGDDGDPSAVLGGEVRAGAGADDHAERRGDQGEAGGERRVAEDELQVLRLEEHGAGHGEEQHGQGDAGGAEGRVAEQPQVEHRVVAAHLPQRGTPRWRRRRT